MRRTPKDTEASARKVSRRALILGGAQMAFVAVLGARMRYMQVEKAGEYQLLAEENRINIRLIPPARGLILDRNGKLIAGNEQNYRVVITREEAGDVDMVLARLSEVMPLKPEDIDKTKKEMARRSSFVPIVVTDWLRWQDLSAVAVNTPALPGVNPEVGLSRHYPRAEDFAHVVGYVGPVSDADLAQLADPDPLLQIPKFQIGKIGVEKWMEHELRGKAGTTQIEVNSVGRVMRELDRQEGVPGEDLRLTIDADVQNFAQARIAGESAAVVVMDVTNGDLIAIASAPSFDPNLFVRGISHDDYSVLMENDHRPLANKAVQGAYPPGSTFKVVTGLAALEAGVITPGTTVYCPGYIEMGNRRFHCWKHSGHGYQDMVGGLKNSCDVYFYEIAQKVGIDKIAEMGRKLGLGQRHDLPMSAIAEGVMPDKEWKQTRHKADWRIGDTINAAIGQGYVLATPLQLAVMTARVATGKEVKPRLIHSIGTEDQTSSDFPSLGINPANLRTVEAGMDAVMNAPGGTAAASRIVDPTMTMAGKTGTSQVRNISASERASGVIKNSQLPWNRRDHALFVCYAPVNNPKYAISVIVEHGSGGSTAAAPIARDIMLRALTGGMPPLDAYPAGQRGKIEEQQKNMDLRPAEAETTVSTRA